MRRAVSFFGIATGIYLISLLFGSRGGGLIACVTVALLYILFPIFFTKVVALVPNAPLGLLVATLWIVGFATTIAISLAVLALPALLIYATWFRAARYIGLPGASLITIGLIAAWIFLRRQQWELLGQVWTYAGRAYELVLEPIVGLMSKIWAAAEGVGKAVVGK